MKTFKCEEMMCDHCVSRIHNALEAEGIGHEVSLEQKSVAIQKDEEAAKAVALLDDLGFSAVEL